MPIARTDTTIAQEILRQMGGRKVTVMTGAKQFVALENGLMFKFPNRTPSRGNHVKVTLRGDDLYDVEFSMIRGIDIKQVKLYEGVYNDQLVGIFESQTGLYLSLGTMRGSF